MNHQLFIPSTIHVLGCDEQDRVLIWSEINRHLYSVELDALNHPKLIQMSGLQAVLETEHFIREIDKDFNPSSIIRDSVAEESRKCRFYLDDRTGQGLWRNPAGAGLLLVSGDEAYTFQSHSGGIRLTKLAEPILNGKLIQFGRKWLDVPALGSAMASLSPGSVKATWEELVALLGCWNFKHQHDSILIAALIVATAVQSSWQFRPQVSMIGKTNTGKSALRDFLAHLWPYAKKMDGKTTEAALRRVVDCDGLPVLLDEFEACRSRQNVMELLRSSTRGGEMYRAKGYQGVDQFKMNHIVWTFAIDDGQKDEADNNRFARFALNPPVERIQTHNVEYLLPLRLKLLAAAMIYHQEIDALWLSLAQSGDFKGYGRLAEVYALPAAIYSAMAHVEAQGFLEDVLMEKSADLLGRRSNDEQELLDEILAAVPRGCSATVAHLLADTMGIRDSELEIAGFRKLDNRVLIAYRIVENQLSLSARWKDKALVDFLERLPGAEPRKRERINKMPQWVVALPWATLFPPDDEGIPF